MDVPDAVATWTVGRRAGYAPTRSPIAQGLVGVASHAGSCASSSCPRYYLSRRRRRAAPRRRRRRQRCRWPLATNADRRPKFRSQPSIAPRSARGRLCTGKKTPGGAGTHTGTRTHRRTSQPSQPTNAPERPRDDRISGRLNGRSPGADRSPRPTRRPPPANPTQPPPAPPGGAGHTHAPDHTRTPRPQTTPEPRDAHIATNHRTPLTPDQATHAPVQRGSHR